MTDTQTQIDALAARVERLESRTHDRAWMDAQGVLAPAAPETDDTATDEKLLETFWDAVYRTDGDGEAGIRAIRIALGPTPPAGRAVVVTDAMAEQFVNIYRNETGHQLYRNRIRMCLEEVLRAAERGEGKE